MQVCKAFWRLALNKLPSSLIYFLVFMVITIIFSGSAADSNANKFTASALDICVIDQDDSTVSKALTDYLGSIHDIQNLSDTTDESLQDNLYYEMISYTLTIPKGFSESVASGDHSVKLTTAKRQDSASGYFLDQQIDAYMNELSLYMTSGLSVEEACKQLKASIKDTPEVTSVSFDQTTKKENETLYYFFQYLPYVFLMMLLEGLTPILVAFHREEIGNRIACSSMPPNVHNTILAVCCAAYSVAVWAAFMVLGMIMYGPAQMFSHNGLLCIANSFVFMLITVAITLLLSVFGLHDNALNMVSNVLGLGMSFLCGIFVPQYYLGDAVLSVGRFLPAYWYVRIINMISGISGEAFSMHTYGTFIGVQLLFLAAIFALYLAVSKRYSHNRNT